MTRDVLRDVRFLTDKNSSISIAGVFYDDMGQMAKALRSRRSERQRA